MGNPWVLLSIPVPVPAIHRFISQGSVSTDSSGVVATKIHSFNYILNYNIIPPYEQVLVGMRWIASEHKEMKKKKKAVQDMHVPWAREKKGRNPGDTCLLGLVSPCHPLTICRLLVPIIVVPSLFIIVSSPLFLSLSFLSPLFLSLSSSSLSFSFSSPLFSPCCLLSPCPHCWRPSLSAYGAPCKQLLAAVGVGAGSPLLSIV